MTATDCVGYILKRHFDNDFIFVGAPFVEKQVAPLKELSGFIDEHDVNTIAYSYTGSELAAQAALGARSTVEHPPRGPNRQRSIPLVEI